MSVLLSLTVAFCALLAALSWLWASRARTNVPGPRTLPLLGNALYFLRKHTVGDHFRALHRQYGDVYRFYVGTKLFVMVTRPDDVQKLLTVSKRRDPFFTRPVQAFVGEGLLTSSGSKWKIHRRAIAPAFGQEVVSKSIDTFNNVAEFVCERLKKSVGSKLEAHRLLFEASLRSIMDISFGASLDELLPETVTVDTLVETLLSALQFSEKRVFRPWMHPDWTLSLMADGRRFRKMVNILHKMIKRGTEVISDKPLNEENDQKMVLGDVLLGRYGEKKFPLSDIYDEGITIAVAGSDTSATTMSCVLSLLGLYPEWQDHAVRELDNVYGKGSDYLRPSNMDDLSQLVVIESIIKETMRLLPAIALGTHHVDEAITLGGGKFMVPGDSCVCIAYFLLHRHPDIFPDPDTFDPRRFLKGASAMGNHPYSYLPFGGGIRKCIGERYAMVQMKTVLSAVLRRFRFLPGSTQKELEDMVLSVSNHAATGYNVTCVPR